MKRLVKGTNGFIKSVNLPKCLECSKSSDTYMYTCRFFDFRKLSIDDEFVDVAGFLNPLSDPSPQEVAIWMKRDSKLHVDTATTKYILKFASLIFCELAVTEKNVQDDFVADLIWKRPVDRTREICDVCSTSLFNLHWTCTHCGANACLDCHQERAENIARWKPKSNVDRRERDNFFWLKCNDERPSHKLVLTQIIPDNTLQQLNHLLHSFCEDHNVEMKCLCELVNKQITRPAVKSKDRFASSMRRLKYRSRQPKDSNIQTLCYTVGFRHIAGRQLIKFDAVDESPSALMLFQDQWERGLPVIVAKANANMKKEIWTPQYFSSKFGLEKHYMVNCRNNQQINKVEMKYFWDGFESIANRIPKESNEKAVLKLKDWPTSDDFANVIREHFDDIMSSVPMQAYTTRNGIFNLARYLPDFFSRPDLGPKMYSAYAQAHPSCQGSTNLHLDVSDAVNVMIHVSKPKDAHLLPDQYGKRAMLLALEMAGADDEDKANVANDEKLPGAIWHIWRANQADGIRKVLFREALLKGEKRDKNDDPIHDQSNYIDKSLRLKLEDEGIRGYTIVQYEGDAVFIPAGAPHQVLNVLDCIKVALDFVAPENLVECVNLTEEFRTLSTKHQNHEDKLQIKNILHHTVKNLVSPEM